MKSKHMAIGGLLTALGIIILYLTLLIPTNTLTLLTVASFMVCITLILTNFHTACVVYITTGILSFFFLPINLSILYIFFFGCYGLVKAQIERLDKQVLESVLKLIFFNTIFFTTFNILESALGIHILEPLKQLSLEILPNTPNAYWIVFIILAQIGFTIFDYALTLLIEMYYNYRYKKK